MLGHVQKKIDCRDRIVDFIDRTLILPLCKLILQISLSKKSKPTEKNSEMS